jgi:peptidoglycan/LPS O-acetylase OafA/YrhL
MAAAAIGTRLPLKPWHGLALAGLGLALICYGWYLPYYALRGLKVGLPALLVVIGILASEPLWPRHRAMLWFARLGDASYSIYIVHFFFVTALTTLLQKSPAVREALGPYGYIVLAMAVGLGSGILTHIYVERPLLALVRGWLPKRRPQSALASPAKV